MKNTYTKVCPITYEVLENNEKYTKKGLRLLSPKLLHLQDFPFSAEEQRKEAQLLASKLSIQGVQLKLSANLNIKNQGFEICNIGGTYILKPQSAFYTELPENEDLSMRLASAVNIEVPLHGLLHSRDGSYTYFIKRFDRVSRNQKVPLEDFAQLAGLTRESKYSFSMEKMIPVIEQYCTFPMIEKKELFSRVLFNFMIGNEDMHVKNFSLISKDNKVQLSPAYDFLNTTIALKGVKEEIALPLNGKKSNLKKKDIVEYFGIKKLGLNETVVNEILSTFKSAIPIWEHLIGISFLSQMGKDKYKQILEKRIKVIFS